MAEISTEREPFPKTIFRFLENLAHASGTTILSLWDCADPENMNSLAS